MDLLTQIIKQTVLIAYVIGLPLALLLLRMVGEIK